MTETPAAPLSGAVCIRKCSDIPDLAFLAAIDECCSLRTEPGGRYPYTMATRWDVAAILAGHREDVGGSPRDYPGVPEKVVMAKATKLDKRKLISGCGCGCRGDFEVTAKGRELQRAFREQVRQDVLTAFAIPADSPMAPLVAAVNAVIEDDERNGIPVARSQWTPEDCTCPWPWPLDGHVRLDCPHYQAKPLPGADSPWQVVSDEVCVPSLGLASRTEYRGGRDARTDCRWHDSGVWIHARPHTCPPHARG
jgi:hypothetical protein